MAYTTKNFKTKKELKEAVELWNKWNAENKSAKEHHPLSVGAVLAFKNPPSPKPVAVYCYQPGPFGPDLSNFTGKVYLEGPHYPKPHSWYAEAWMESGKVVKVK